MKRYPSLFIISLCTGMLAPAGCTSNVQQEFEEYCLPSGRSQANCRCIYLKLEDRYSPKLIKQLGKVSLQSTELPDDFIPTLLEIMDHCDKELPG